MISVTVTPNLEASRIIGYFWKAALGRENWRWTPMIGALTIFRFPFSVPTRLRGFSSIRAPNLMENTVGMVWLIDIDSLSLSDPIVFYSEIIKEKWGNHYNSKKYSTRPTIARQNSRGSFRLSNVHVTARLTIEVRESYCNCGRTLSPVAVIWHHTQFDSSAFTLTLSNSTSFLLTGWPVLIA